MSQRVNAIYCSVTDQVEPFSVDESWLDVTGSRNLFGDGKTIADELRRRVREELGITISVGVSDNRYWAKLGSDYKKPDATTVITRENVAEILHPLPIREMLKDCADKFGE
jgi:DNA polymerase-4